MGTRVRKLKCWNGNGFGKFEKSHVCVAATSQGKAAKLVTDAGQPVSVNEFRKMFNDVWGSDMSGIVPQEPCVFVVKDGEAPERVI